MAILSKRLFTDIGREYNEKYQIKPGLLDLSGNISDQHDPAGILSNIRRKRAYALQESINSGETFVFYPVPSVASWVVAVENRRMIHGGLICGEVLVAEKRDPDGGAARYLSGHGMTSGQADAYISSLPVWNEARVTEAAKALKNSFYTMSGWKPVILEENRLKALQQEQIAQAIEDHRRSGKTALYAFEKERILLASIRAGDRNGARRILNEMLAAIYLSSPQLVVLRARAVELMSCLTRAAIEDNPLLEPLIARNHVWTERLVKAKSFEDLSQVLMEALDDFIDGIYLHGLNRSNMKVRKALDFVALNFGRKISLGTIAREVGLSPYRLSHLVKEHTGKTVLQTIQQERIRHAQRLLERTATSCTEVAYECGFHDQSHFIKHFRRLTGVTPAKYRKTSGASE